ncbi:hypothetical protein L596_015650 [Steinernema carpocapsae]|uniref:ABC transporter domain-containing protein n=1 Tax=Steinernema carpocapsae TaxID=34508 RepID=A0A4U5NGL4_STECR|nr:hypothetical protein L596_015650 [Steinernema carpocapsae]
MRRDETLFGEVESENASSTIVGDHLEKHVDKDRNFRRYRQPTLFYTKIPIDGDDLILHKGNWSYVAYGKNSSRPFLEHLRSNGFVIVDHHEHLLSAVRKHSFFGVELFEAADVRNTLNTPRLSYKIYGLRRELKNLKKDWDILSNPLSTRMDHMKDALPLFAMKYSLDSHYKDWIERGENATIDDYIILEPLPDFQRLNGAIEYMEGKATFSVSSFQMALLILIVMMARDVFSEKITGMRSYLGVMGVCRICIYSAHFIRGFCTIFFHCFVLSLCLVPELNMSVGILMLITLFLYALAATSYIMFLTTFFRSSIGLIVGAIVCWVGSIQLPVDNAYFNFNKAIIFAFSPNIALQYSFRSLAEQYTFDDFNYVLRYAYMYAGLIPMWTIFVCYTIVTTSTGLLFEAIIPVNDCPTIRSFEWLKKRVKVHSEKPVESSGDLDCLFPWEMILRTMDDCDVKVDQMTKQFPKSAKPAVDRFNFRAYRNEVTVLLGHNGAGKSTAFNVMCGIEKPTSGKVEICGKNIVTDLTACRANISYCPQTNPIFKSMTVREHLCFFKALKSMDEHVDGDKDNRHINQLLNDLELKDIADKIAYKLSGGQLRKLCIGIALAGYSPVVLLDEPTAGIDSVARKTIEEVIHRYKKGRTIILTTHYMDEAEHIGDRIAIMAKGRLCTYGSPEFLKRKFGSGYFVTIELEDTEENSESMFDERAQAIQDFVAKRTQLWKFITRTGIENRIKMCLPFEGRSSYAQLFEALEEEKENLHIQIYTLHLNTLEQVFLAVGELVEDTARDHPKPSTDKVMTTLTTCLNGIVVCSVFTFHSLFPEPRTTGFDRFLQQVTGLLAKRWFYITQSPKVTIVSIIFPWLFVLAALGICNSDKGANSIIRVFENSSKCFGEHLVEIAENSLPSAQRLALATPDDSTVKRIFSNSTEHFPHLPPVAFGFLPPLKVKKRVQVPRILYNPSAFHSVFSALNIFGNAQLNDKNAIGFAVESLPEKIDLEYLAKSYIVPVVVCFSLGMVMSGSIVFLNQERSSSFQQQQYLTSMFKVTYWSCQLVFDWAIYVLGAGVIALLLIVFDYSIYSTHPAGLFFFFAMYFFAFAPLIYVLSHVFSTSTKAYLIAVLFDVMVSFATNVVTLLAGLGLMFIAPEEGFTVVQYAQYAICVVSPTSALQHGLMTMGNEQHPEEAEAAFLFLTSSMTIYTTILFLIESRALRYWRARKKGETVHQDNWDALSLQSSINEDVLKDLTTVREFPEKCSAVLAKDLYKSYENIPVVKGLNFYAKRGECFALLGKNGAGKTTTFKMLTGEVSPEEGTITIDGNKTLSALTDVAIGYCPQMDSFLPALSPWQNMVVQAKLSGIKNVEDCVDAVLHAVDLMPDAHVKSKVLSGGQKRRLSVAMSVLAELPVVLLDEPTTGIDPVAKHLIWALLSAIRNLGMSVVMTSHDMDECEAICSRASFMRYGAVVATGSPCHLICTYTPGFGITITVQEPSSEALVYFDKLMQEKLNVTPSISAEDDETYSWEIPREGEQKLSRIFTVMEELYESHKCEEGECEIRCKTKCPLLKTENEKDGNGKREKAQDEDASSKKDDKFKVVDYTVESNCLQDVVTFLSHSSRESLWMLGHLERIQQRAMQDDSSSISSADDFFPEPTERELAVMKKRMSIISAKLSVSSKPSMAPDP